MIEAAECLSCSSSCIFGDMAWPRVHQHSKTEKDSEGLPLFDRIKLENNNHTVNLFS